MTTRHTFEADGLQTEFTFTFPYLDRSHVKVYLDGLMQIYALGYLIEGQKVIFANAPKIGSVVEITRLSSPDNPIVDFTDGSVLREKDLDTAYLHNFYRTQENRDYFNKLINDVLLGLTDGTGITATEPDEVFAALVNKLLEDDLLEEFRRRIADIDLNAETIVNLGEGLQTQINTLAEGTAALVFVQPEEPVPGVDGIPSPIPDGARWYDTDDNNHAYVYDEATLTWVSIRDPRIGQNANNITQLGVQLTTLDESATATSDALQVLDTTVTSIDGRVTASAADITNLTSALESTDGSVAANAGAISGLTTRVTLAEQEISSTSSDVTVLTNRISTAEGNITSQSTAVSGLVSDVSRIDGELTAQASDITSLGVAVEDVEAGVAAQGTALGGLTTRVTAAEGEIESVSGDVTSLNSRVGTAETTLSGQATALGGLTTRVTQAENSITSQSSDITSLQSSIANTNSNVTANSNAISGIQTTVSDLDGDVSSISTQLTTLNTSLTNTQNTVSAHTTSISALDGRITSNDNDITAINSSITSLQSSLSNTNASISANSSAISGIDSRVSSTESSISSQASSITNLQADITTIEGDIASANVSITAAANAAATANSKATTAQNAANTANNGVTALEAMYGVRLSVNGYVTGFIQNNDGQSGNFVILADKFAVVDPSGDPGEPQYVPFEIVNGKINMRGSVQIDGSLVVNGSLNGVKITDDSISASKISADQIRANHIEAGSILARHLAIDSDTGVTRTVFNPESNSPLLITDSATGDAVFEVKLVEGVPKATVNGTAGEKFVSNANAISEEVKRIINPYYLGASGSASATTGAMATGATKAFTVNTSTTGRVSISFKLHASASSTTGTAYATPDWTVKVFRDNTGTTPLYNKRHTGSTWETIEDLGGGDFERFSGYSITIDDGFVDEAAPVNGSEYYILQVTRNNATTGPTSLNLYYFKGESGGYLENEASTAQNGYWKDKDTGLIHQWGRNSVAANSNATISFPITFPTGCRSVVAIELMSTTEATKTINTTSIGSTNFGVRNNIDNTVTVCWHAIGV